MNLNPKNGLFNGLIAGSTAGIFNLIIGIGMYVSFGFGAISSLLIGLIMYIVLFGIGGGMGGIWKKHQN